MYRNATVLYKKSDLIHRLLPTFFGQSIVLLPQLYLTKINVAMELNHRKIVKYSIHLC